MVCHKDQDKAGYFRKRICFFKYGYRPLRSWGFRVSAPGREEVFKNGDVSFSCGREKTEVFKYDDVMPKF